MKSSPFSKVIPAVTGLTTALVLASIFILAGDDGGWGLWVLPPILGGLVTYLMSMKEE